MNEDEDWRSCEGLSMALPQLLAMEAVLPLEAVHAAAQAGGQKLGAISEGVSDGQWAVVVQVDNLEPPRWTELSRHDEWSESHDSSSQTLARLVDHRRHALPVSTGDRPDVIVNIPCRDGLSCLYLTDAGVALVRELFDAPGELEHDAPGGPRSPRRWTTTPPTFRSCSMTKTTTGRTDAVAPASPITVDLAMSPPGRWRLRIAILSRRVRG